VAFKPVVPTSPGAVTSSTSTLHASRSTSGPCVTSQSSVEAAGTCSAVALPGRRSTDDGYSSSRGADVNRSSSSEASQSSINGTAVGDHDDREPGAAAGTCDLEEAVRGKDAELRRLRETMEQNETAIMAVLQERRRGWHAQMAALTQEWQLKLRCQQQASFRTEQSLLLQVLKLQQENRALRSGGGDLRAAKARVEELEWELRERTSDDAALRTQIESCSSQLDAVRRAAAADTDALRARVDEELASGRAAAERAAAAERRATAADDTAQRAQRAVESLQAELSRTRAALETQRADFERQREQWLDEKRRVIDYQKQLQLNYVQIARKNRLLEADVQQLTAEIEHHESVPSLMRHAADESLC